MPVSEEYRLFLLEQLSRVAPVTTRRMFGGLGLYTGGVFFGLVDDDVLFVKVDAESRPRFVAEGSRPFEPWEGHVMDGYWEVPAGALEDEERLRSFVDGAVKAARARAVRGSARAAPPNPAGSSKKPSRAAKPRPRRPR